MARFRDVKSVSVFGTPWTGVQNVSVNVEADSFESSGDNNIDIRRVDVTKQKITFTIEVQDPDFKRDIKDPAFGSSPGVSLNEVQKISLKQSCSVLTDSAEEDQWITYIGTTKAKTEAEVELRDISQIRTEGTIKIGDKDSLIFKVLPGASTSGLADSSAYEQFEGKNMVVTGITGGEKHGEVNGGTLSMIGFGDDSNVARIYNTLSGGGSSGFEKHCGDTGTVSWTSPSVSGSGGDEDVSIANCVCTGVEIEASHAGRLTRRFTFEAYSSDGSTTPLTLS